MICSERSLNINVTVAVVEGPLRWSALNDYVWQSHEHIKEHLSGKKGCIVMHSLVHSSALAEI